MQETWSDVASSARRAANLLVGEHHRSCVSRAYYAAYSRITHRLAAAPGVSYPIGKEGPSHPGKLGTGGIRKLVESSMPDLDHKRRQKLSELIGRLYTLRVFADYHPSVEVDDRDAREAISIMHTIFDAF